MKNKAPYGKGEGIGIKFDLKARDRHRLLGFEVVKFVFNIVTFSRRKN